MDPDGRKIFVTHKKPHLDEVTAAWLLQKFDPTMADCTFHFITNTPSGGEVPPGGHYVPVGVGRGKYDEHGLQAGHSACQLVYQDLDARGLIPKDPVKRKAIELVVEYTHKQDTAQWDDTDPLKTNFAIPSILRGFAILNPKDASQVMMDNGLAMVKAVYANLKEYAQFLLDWEDRIEFSTQWGKGVGVHSSYRGADSFAYHYGFALRVQTDPAKPYGDMRGPANSDMDLTPIYEKLESREPGRWFLHQTKRLLVSNAEPNSGRQATELTLQQLIDLVKV